MISIVVGLHFGDEGKGRIVDLKTFENSADVVVRFCGGQQAGHTVELGGIRHVFSSFGSGTLRGAGTFFSEHCTIYPLAMMNELDVLNGKGVSVGSVMVHPRTIVTTPYDVVSNRQNSPEGMTCGMGVGATMTRHNSGNIKIFAQDLFNEWVLKEKMLAVASYYGVAVWDDVLANWERSIELVRAGMIVLTEYSELANLNIVMEGAQGTMLDMDHGFFPYVTYANTTVKNAMDVISKIGYTGKVDVNYVTRAYLTRHGSGPVPDGEKLTDITDETNVLNPFQGEFRCQVLDRELLLHAIKINKSYIDQPLLSSVKVEETLCVTCVDQLSGKHLTDAIGAIDSVSNQVDGIRCFTKDSVWKK